MTSLRMLPIALLAAGLVFFVGSSGSASAQPPCGTVTANTILAGDCAGPMTVAASNITINLNGFSVVGGGIGIVINNQVNVHVRNGTVTGAQLGILLGGSGGNHLLHQLTVSGNQFTAIDLSNGGNRVLRNNLSNNSTGILVFGSSDNTIVGNTTNNNLVGITVTGGSQSNRLLRNTALGNSLVDLRDLNILPSCDNNVWQNNTFGTANDACIN